MRMAASLAYYTIFSLAPLLVIAIAIAGLVFGERAAQNAIAGQIQGFVGPDSAKTIQTMIESAHKHTQGIVATVVGVMTLLIGASGVFSEIQDALNTIWHVDPKEHSGTKQYIKSRLLSLGMVLSIGFLLLVSLLLSAFLAGIFKYVGGLLPLSEIFLYALELIASLSVVTALFAVIFKVLPNVRLTWNDVSFGAFATALLFTIGKFAIGFYLGKTVSTSSYGAAGSIILVIAWIYYSALIFYFGAKFTRVYTIEFGSVLIGSTENASKTGGAYRSSEMGMVAPRTSWREIFSRKTKEKSHF